jgi:hypothetical protein
LGVYPFLEEVFVAVIGSALGAGGAIFAAILLRRREAKRNEGAALLGLIAELHLRRALATNLERDLTDGDALGSADFARVGQSVIDIRAQIRDVRRLLRPNSQAFEPLNNMSRACNFYLERSAARPGSYMSQLNDLRDSLESRVDEIAAKFKFKVDGLKPGMGAFPQPD